MTEKTQKIARGMCVLGTAVLLSGAPVHAELQSGGTLLVPGTIMGAPVTAKAEAKSAAQVEAAQQAAKSQTSSLADLASADVLEITDAPLPADIKSEAAPQVIAPVVQAPKAEEVKPVEVAVAAAAESAPATQQQEEVKSVVPPVALGNGTVIGNPVYAKGDAKRAKPAPVVAAPAEPMVAKVEAPAPAAPAPEVAPEVAKVAEVAKPAAVEAKPAAPAVKMVSLESELKRLAPAKYRLIYASNVNKSAKVPQASGKNWQESVNAVAQSAGLRIEDSNGLMFVSKSMTTSADYKAAGIAPAAPVQAEAPAEIVVAKTEQPAVAAEPAVVPEPVVAAPEVALASADEPVAETADSAAVVAAATTDTVEDEEPGFFGRLFADIGSWFGGDGSAASTVEAEEAPVAVAQADAAPAPVAEPVVEQASAPVEAETTMVAAAPKTEAVAAVEPAAGVVPAPEAMPAPSAKVEQPVAAPPVAAPPVSSPDMVAYAGSNFKPRADDKPVAQETVWRAEQGQTLLQVIRAWSEKAGVQLYWDSKYDYPLQASVTLTGSYENAVRSLLQGFENAAPQPIARLHRQGNSGNKVLIIRNRGNIYGVR